MNGPDSISDPVARRISYTGSYPSARGSAPTRLGSSRLGARLMMWQVGPAVLTCQPRGSSHLVFGLGQPILAKKTRVTHGARLCAWLATLLARAAVSDIRF